MGVPPPRHINTKSTGDVHREQLIKWIEDGHWFTSQEACKHLDIPLNVVRRYIYELRDRGYLQQQKREHNKGKRRPIEYQFRDNWCLVTESDNPIVKKHVERLRHLAEIYMTGQFPRHYSLDDALREVADEIEDLQEVVKILRMITENPDMRSINYFVKRMR